MTPAMMSFMGGPPFFSQTALRVASLATHHGCTPCGAPLWRGAPPAGRPAYQPAPRRGRYRPGVRRASDAPVWPCRAASTRKLLLTAVFENLSGFKIDLHGAAFPARAARLWGWSWG